MTADLVAVLVAVTDGAPKIVTIAGGSALPSGPFEFTHRFGQLTVGERGVIFQVYGRGCQLCAVVGYEVERRRRHGLILLADTDRRPYPDGADKCFIYAACILLPCRIRKLERMLLRRALTYTIICVCHGFCL